MKLKAFFERCMSANSETPQFLILGLDGAGKTTLLYRLRLGTSFNVKPTDMLALRKLNPDAGVDGNRDSFDAGYHNEEISRGPLGTHSVWEVPGSDAMRHIWPCLYHAIKIHAVIFVVDESDEDEGRINLAKMCIHQLMNEDELRFAAFIIVVNQKTAADNRNVDDSLEESDNWLEANHPLRFKLGLDKDLHSSCYWRLHFTIFNAKDITASSPKWTKALEKVKTVLKSENGYYMKNL